MPYVCVLQGRKWELRKKDGSKIISHHATKGDCTKNLRALYANEITNEADLRFEGRLYNLDIDPSLIVTNESGVIRMVINGEGGSMLGAIKIHNALRNSGKRIIGYIPAIAFSAHAILALACDELYIAENGSMMFHPPKAELQQNTTLSADELTNMADTLDVAETMLVNTLMSKTKKTEQECRMIMGKDTWFTAQQALDCGIVDGIIPILRDVEIRDYFPVEIVNYVKGKQEMALKDICDKFGISATTDNAEEKLTEFITALQKRPEPAKPMEVSNSMMKIVKNARETELKLLSSEGKLIPVQVTDLSKNYLTDDRIRFDIQNDNNEFENILNIARKGEAQIKFGGSGSGAQVLNKGDKQDNPLIRDAERRRDAVKIGK